MQVWRIAPGGDPKQVTALPLGRRFVPRESEERSGVRDGRGIRDRATSRAARSVSTPGHRREHGIVYDKIFVRHWDTWSDGRRSSCSRFRWTVGPADGTPVNLTSGLDGDVPSKPFGGAEDYAISPDGQLVAFSVRAVPVGEPWSTNFDIYIVPAAGGTPRNLTADNPAKDEQPAFSPDGTRLAYLASERPGFESDRLHLVLVDLKTVRETSAHPGLGPFHRSYRGTPNGKTLFATTDHLGQHPLWAIDVRPAGPPPSPATAMSRGSAWGRRRFSTPRARWRSRESVFGRIRRRQAPPVHPGQPGGTRGAALGEYQQFQLHRANGDNVFGYVVKPANFKRDQKYPVAFLIHGGPQGSMANKWHWRWNAQVFAGAGYGVVMIDFHGSTGYGQAFTDSISGDWGVKPLEDLKLGWRRPSNSFPGSTATRHARSAALTAAS